VIYFWNHKNLIYLDDSDGYLHYKTLKRHEILSNWKKDRTRLLQFYGAGLY
jgi:hypothetical protein